MALHTIDIPRLDPYNFTGPVRELAGIVRTGAVTFDVAYGYPEFARWIYVGTAGNLSFVKWDGTTETLPNIVAGFWHPIHSIMINSSGTTIAAAQLRWGS
jgi:hypothetical protein